MKIPRLKTEVFLAHRDLTMSLIRRMCIANRLAICDLQLPQFVQFHLQTMSQRAFASKFIQQFFGFRKRLVVVGSPFEQGLPAARYFSFGQHEWRPLGVKKKFACLPLW
jgi:hypothetical protein